MKFGVATRSLDSKRVPVKTPDRRPGPYPYWGASGVVDHVDSYLFDHPALLVSEDGENLKTRKTPIAFLVKGKYWVNNHAHVAVAADGYDLRFLYYAMSIADVSGYLTGSTQPKLTAGSLSKMTIEVPELEEQRRIAAVLGGLDDLIGINQRLTAQLNDAASVTAVRALRLAPSRISIGDVAAHLPGKYLSKDQYVPAGPFVVYGSNSIMGNYSEALYDGPLTVLARIGSNCGALRLSPGGAWINNNASAIKANSGQPAFWIHAALEQIDMDTHRGGSGQPFIRIESLMKESIPWGDQALLESTNKLLGELANATATLSEEIRALATTRDELLPLLMSGAVAPGEVTVAS